MTCRVELINPTTYGPGKTIHGKAFCQFNTTENFKAIKCIFRGIEKTAWTARETYRGHNNKRQTRFVHCGGDNMFLSKEGILAENGQLPPGQYEYLFAFNLPLTMPSSFEGPHGSIEYSISLIVDKGIVTNYRYDLLLSVVSPVDLNQLREQLQLQPTNYQDEKTLCCWCCASGPITMELLLEKEAFVIGEKVKVTVKIVNMSNKTIPKLDLCLQQIIEYRSNGVRHTFSEDYLASFTTSGVGAHGERTYPFDLEIPASANIPNFSGSILFNSHYNLVAKAVVPGLHSNMHIITQELIVGHIPLANFPTPTSKLLGPEVNPPPPYSFNVTPAIDGPPGFGEKGIPPGNFTGSASAPREEDVASAPSKAEMSEKGQYDSGKVGVDNTLPPSYEDSNKGFTLNPPSAPSI